MKYFRLRTLRKNKLLLTVQQLGQSLSVTSSSRPWNLSGNEVSDRASVFNLSLQSFPTIVPGFITVKFGEKLSIIFLFTFRFQDKVHNIMQVIHSDVTTTPYRQLSNTAIYVSRTILSYKHCDKVSLNCII